VTVDEAEFERERPLGATVPVVVILVTSLDFRFLSFLIYSRNSSLNN